MTGVAPADVVIAGGTVIDGTGAEGFAADLAIVGDRVQVLRRAAEEEATVEDAGVPSSAGSSARPARVIDATGMVVAPGFIDLHSHSGLMLFADPRHEPKVRQGVTSELIGVDGNSYAPFSRREDLEAFVELNAGLDGDARWSDPGFTYDWDSVAGHLGRLDNAVAVNVGYVVGNSALRASAVGWDERPASDEEIASMRAMLREGLEEGAFGVSSGLDYPPGSYADTAELAALTEEAGRRGAFYHTHVRYQLGDRYLDPFREAIEIGRRGSAPAHITHFYHRATYPGGPQPMLELVESARAEGLDVTFDSYPYEWSSTRLLIELPGWAQSGGPELLRDRLRDERARARIADEMRDRWARSGIDVPADIRLGNFRSVHSRRFEGQTLAAVASELGDIDPADALLGLLGLDGLQLNEVRSGPSAATLPSFIAHPVGMVGTDSVFVADLPSPRTYGAYPRILGEFVRDRALLPLAEAIRKMTSAPAARLGLRDRGVLSDGAFADVVVFDPQRVRSLATYDQPKAFPEGIEHVFVNGVQVVDRGRHTGALPGRALRSGR
jgi:N-acyl-D-amino-acid deacylase